MGNADAIKKDQTSLPIFEDCVWFSQASPACMFQACPSLIGGKKGRTHHFSRAIIWVQDALMSLSSTNHFTFCFKYPRLIFSWWYGPLVLSSVVAHRCDAIFQMRAWQLHCWKALPLENLTLVGWAYCLQCARCDQQEALAFAGWAHSNVFPGDERKTARQSWERF